MSHTRFILLQVLLIISVHFSAAQKPVNPEIPNYGTVYLLDNVENPATNEEYRIVIDLKTPVTDPLLVNSGLNNVARMINLHVAGGISPEKISVAVAIHGEATSITLDHEGYLTKHGVQNPNIKLMEQLQRSGVELYVCGQSLVGRSYDFDDINGYVKPALSMLTTVTSKMNQGYNLLVFE